MQGPLTTGSPGLSGQYQRLQSGAGRTRKVMQPNVAGPPIPQRGLRKGFPSLLPKQPVGMKKGGIVRSGTKRTQGSPGHKGRHLTSGGTNEPRGYQRGGMVGGGQPAWAGGPQNRTALPPGLANLPSQAAVPPAAYGGSPMGIGGVGLPNAVPSYVQAPGRPTTGYAKGGRVLSAKQRQALPRSSFALPGRGTGKKGAGPGSYPIPDISHARNALARSSGKSVAGAVRRKVHAKFPSIGRK